VFLFSLWLSKLITHSMRMRISFSFCRCFFRIVSKPIVAFQIKGIKVLISLVADPVKEKERKEKRKKKKKKRKRKKEGAAWFTLLLFQFFPSINYILCVCLITKQCEPEGTADTHE